MVSRKLTKKTSGYAFATSPTATKNGFGKTGCWYVGTKEDLSPKVDNMKCCATKEEARKLFDSLDLPIHPLSAFGTRFDR